MEHQIEIPSKITQTIRATVEAALNDYINGPDFEMYVNRQAEILYQKRVQQVLASKTTVNKQPKKNKSWLQLGNVEAKQKYEMISEVFPIADLFDIEDFISNMKEKYKGRY